MPTYVPIRHKNYENKTDIPTGLAPTGDLQTYLLALNYPKKHTLALTSTHLNPHTKPLK